MQQDHGQACKLSELGFYQTENFDYPVQKKFQTLT